MINMIRTFFENGGFYLIVIMRLLLACILGGLIGYERESTNRPPVLELIFWYVLAQLLS